MPTSIVNWQIKLLEIVKGIFDKISSYNIFNYLLPGIVFVFLKEEITALAGFNFLYSAKTMPLITISYSSSAWYARWGALLYQV